MPYSLAPGHSFGVADGHAIVLDLAHDRYFRLSSALSKILIGVGDGTPELAAAEIEPLKRCGVLVDGDDGPRPVPVTLPSPTSSALEECRRRAGANGCIQVAQSVTATRIALAVRGFAATIARARHAYRSTNHRTDIHGAAATAQIYANVRPQIPIARACVLDSLALSTLLSRSGIAHDVILGVRLSPFAAHAWVQTDHQVLSDKLDPVLESTPVFRL